ncbi:hypothetical protein ACJRO7_001501 [Eucalyptus globulus]|uniref:Uncharacterized protein n=1 Tax=Eucalyptus globulus TaxID=34317 RepID=A0ABD3M143_EUCGL
MFAGTQQASTEGCKTSSRLIGLHDPSQCGATVIQPNVQQTSPWQSFLALSNPQRARTASIDHRLLDLNKIHQGGVTLTKTTLRLLNQGETDLPRQRLPVSSSFRQRLPVSCTQQAGCTARQA